ncbi:MAG: hypothetical protein O2875_00375 [Planctomycetota bacterium]|nr:hypothetical protein [Planctomycetota bacterium]MDA1262435.1 hypothetical protein [Planctomycetota bacterium]
MHNLVGILLGIFVLCILGASHFTRRALSSLDEEHRAELVRIASNSSMMNLAVPIVIAIAYTIVVINNREQMATATVFALGVLLVQGIITAVIADRAYRAAGMPSEFLKNFRIARGIRILGSSMLFAGVIAWLLSTQNAQDFQFDPNDPAQVETAPAIDGK